MMIKSRRETKLDSSSKKLGCTANFAAETVEAEHNEMAFSARQKKKKNAYQPRMLYFKNV